MGKSIAMLNYQRVKPIFFQRFIDTLVTLVANWCSNSFCRQANLSSQGTPASGCSWWADNLPPQSIWCPSGDGCDGCHGMPWDHRWRPPMTGFLYTFGPFLDRNAKELTIHSSPSHWFIIFLAIYAMICNPLSLVIHGLWSLMGHNHEWDIAPLIVHVFHELSTTFPMIVDAYTATYH